MKSLKKILAITLCAVMLVGASVMGTLAYLSDNDKVENTFTVGHIDIELDEADTNEDGLLLDKDGNITRELEKSPRVKENLYKIVPGCNYHKDPTVHVAKGSEPFILYVSVDNNMDPVISSEDLEGQILEYGWKRLADEAGDPINDAGGNPLYWREVDENTEEVQHFPVFTGIHASMDADAADLAEVDGENIVVNAYAVQKAGWQIPVDPDYPIVRPSSNAAYIWSQSFGAAEFD